MFGSRQLPRRVSVTLPATGLALCDYCFPDESEEVRTVLIETNNTAHRAAHWGWAARRKSSLVRCARVWTCDVCAAGLQRKSGWTTWDLCRWYQALTVGGVPRYSAGDGGISVNVVSFSGYLHSLWLPVLLFTSVIVDVYLGDCCCLPRWLLFTPVIVVVYLGDVVYSMIVVHLSDCCCLPQWLWRRSLLWMNQSQKTQILKMVYSNISKHSIIAIDILESKD